MSLTRRGLLSAVSGASILAATRAHGLTLSRTASSGRVCLGLAGPTYYTGFNPFLNWWKIASVPTIKRRGGDDLSGKAIWDAGGYLDVTTGEITNPAPADLLTMSRIFFTSSGSAQVAAGCDYSGERWIAKWDGTATCHVDLLTTGGTQTNVGSNQINFTMGKRPGNTAFTLSITNKSDPPRNVRIFQARYAANVVAGEKFNPDWLAEVRKFGILRFMGWMPTNNETVTDFSQLADESYTAWCAPFTSLTSNGNFGPKGSLHPSLICQLANVTGCNVHVCIPIQATDAFVKSFASYFKDNTNVEVTYELSNECWNFQFSQASYCSRHGDALWPGDGARYAKWYGYRSAQCMKIIRDIYNDNARWRGALATQTVNPYVTTSALVGVNYWRANELSPRNSLQVSDLFKSVYVTGYFGDVTRGKPILAITNANPGVVTSKGHGYPNGARIKLFIQTGMVELNNTFATVANVTVDSYELQGVDTTAMIAFSPGNNYSVDAALFDLMDTSNSNFLADPSTYPSKYSQFNRVLTRSFLTGLVGSLATGGSVVNHRNRFWPAQLAIAQAHGLTLRQYEGGCHFTGDVYLSGYGGNSQYVEYMVQCGHCSETASVYGAMYSAFHAVGGEYPAKFVEGGTVGQFGTWAGVRYWPLVANHNTSDVGNPVWAVTLAAN